MATASFATASLRWTVADTGLHSELLDLETTGTYDRKNGSSQPIARVYDGASFYSSNAVAFSNGPLHRCPAHPRGYKLRSGEQVLTITFATLSPSPVLTVLVTPLQHAILIRVLSFVDSGGTVTQVDFPFMATRFGSSGAGGIGTDWWWAQCGARYWDTAERRVLLCIPLGAPVEQYNGNTFYHKSYVPTVADSPVNLGPSHAAAALVCAAEADNATLRERIAEAEYQYSARNGEKVRGLPAVSKLEIFWHTLSLPYLSLLSEYQRRAGAGRVLIGFSDWFDLVTGGIPEGIWFDDATLIAWAAAERAAGIEVGPHILGGITPRDSDYYVNTATGATAQLRRESGTSLNGDLASTVTSGTMALTSVPAAWPSAGQVVIETDGAFEIVNYSAKVGGGVTIANRAYHQSTMGAKDHQDGDIVYLLPLDAATSNYYLLAFDGGISNWLQRIADRAHALFGDIDLPTFFDEIEDLVASGFPAWLVYQYAVRLWTDICAPSCFASADGAGGSQGHSLEVLCGHSDFGDYVNSTTFLTKIATDLAALYALPISAAGSGSGAITGHWRYRYLWTDVNGVVMHSDEARVNVTSKANVRLSGWPTASGGTVSIYRTVTGPGTTYKLVTAAFAASTASYADSIADGSLGAAIGGTDKLVANHRAIGLRRQIGWVRFQGSGTYATPLEIDAVCSIALAGGWPLTIQMTPAQVQTWPLRDANLRLIALYERGRIDGTVLVGVQRLVDGPNAPYMVFIDGEGVMWCVRCGLSSGSFGGAIPAYATDSPIGSNDFLTAWIPAGGSAVVTVPSVTPDDFAAYELTESGFARIAVNKVGSDSEFTFTDRVWIDCGALGKSAFDSATIA